MQESDNGDQTIVPEAFLALYVSRGRPTLDRAALQARFDLADTLAAEVAAMCPAVAADDVRAQRQVLARVHAGLVAEPAHVTAAEALWVVGRVAELLGHADAALEAVIGPIDRRAH